MLVLRRVCFAGAGFLGRANRDSMEAARMLADVGNEFFVTLKIFFCFYTVKTVFGCPTNGDNSADGACCMLFANF